MPRETPPSRLEIDIKHNNRLIENLSLRTDLLDQHLVKIAENVEAVTGQVALFTEGLTRLANLLERQDEKLDRILDAIQNQTRLAEAQARTAETQARSVESQTANIGELTKLVASQAAVVSRLLDRIVAWEKRSP